MLAVQRSNIHRSSQLPLPSASCSATGSQGAATSTAQHASPSKLSITRSTHSAAVLQVTVSLIKQQMRPAQSEDTVTSNEIESSCHPSFNGSRECLHAEHWQQHLVQRRTNSQSGEGQAVPYDAITGCLDKLRGVTNRAAGQEHTHKRLCFHSPKLEPASLG